MNFASVILQKDDSIEVKWTLSIRIQWNHLSSPVNYLLFCYTFGDLISPVDGISSAKIQLSESVLSEAEVEVETEVEEDKRASCCYVLLGRPEGENHCVSYSEGCVTSAFSFGNPREAPLALSRMNFSIGPVHKKNGTPCNTLSQCRSVPRA